MSTGHKTVLAAAAAVGLFVCGYFLAHVQGSVLKISGWVFYAAAVFAAVFLMWKLLRSVIWKTEKRLFTRSVRDFGAEEKTKTCVPECSPKKNSLAE